MEKISADEDLKIRQNAIRILPGSSQSQLDAALARNILHDELGYFTDEQTVYHLDDKVRDRLIAHTRQDTAHALIIAFKYEKSVADIKKLLTFNAALILVVIALLAANLIR